MFSELDKDPNLQKKAALFQKLVSGPDLDPEKLVAYLGAQFESPTNQNWLQYCMKIKLWALQKGKIKPTSMDEKTILKELDFCENDNSRAVFLKAYAKLITHEHGDLKAWLHEHAGNGQAPLGKISFWVLDYLKKTASAPKPPASSNSQPASPKENQEAPAKSTKLIDESALIGEKPKPAPQPKADKKPQVPKPAVPPPPRKKWDGPQGNSNDSESTIKSLGWIITLFIVTCLTLPWLWLAWKVFSTIFKQAI